jgi:hypothetical protein
MQDPVDPDLVRQVLGTLPLIRPVPEAFVEAMVAESAKVPARVWRIALAELTGAVPPTETAPITVPTLIVWGEHDEVLRNEQEALAAAIPDRDSSATRHRAPHRLGTTPAGRPPTSPPSPPTSPTPGRPADRPGGNARHAARSRCSPAARARRMQQTPRLRRSRCARPRSQHVVCGVGRLPTSERHGPGGGDRRECAGDQFPLSRRTSETCAVAATATPIRASRCASLHT